VKHLLLVIASISCALHAAGQPGQSQKATRAAVAAGKDAYMRLFCYSCHGTVGQGGAGPPLAPNTLPLAALEQWIRNGTPGWSVARGMPAFSPSVLPEESLADIRSYLTSVPAPPAVKDIPILNQ
jgi:mono/diheme cytochrome c family protein